MEDDERGDQINHSTTKGLWAVIMLTNQRDRLEIGKYCNHGSLLCDYRSLKAEQAMEKAR